MPTRICLRTTLLLPLALLIATAAAAQEADPVPPAPTIEPPRTEAPKPAKKFTTVVVPPLTAAERRLKREQARTEACEHFTGSRLEREGSRRKRCPEMPGISIKRSDLDKDSAATLGEFLRE